jgi:hypothetical protein
VPRAPQPSSGDVAGGRSSNVAQQFGHRRGRPQPRGVAEESPFGAEDDYSCSSQPAGQPSKQQALPKSILKRPSQHVAAAAAGPFHDDVEFLDRVAEAEQRDNEAAALLEQLLELESQTEMIVAAAAQISAEQGLSPRAEETLRDRMLSRVHEQAAALRAQMKVEAPRKFPAHEDEGEERVAGMSTSAGWRAGATGGPPQMYGDMRVEHHGAPHPRGDRHLQSESRIVFGGTPGGLYPRSDSMIRGKFPGY